MVNGSEYFDPGRLPSAGAIVADQAPHCSLARRATRQDLPLAQVDLSRLESFGTIAALAL